MGTVLGYAAILACTACAACGASGGGMGYPPPGGGPHAIHEAGASSVDAGSPPTVAPEAALPVVLFLDAEEPTWPRPLAAPKPSAPAPAPFAHLPQV